MKTWVCKERRWPWNVPVFFWQSLMHARSAKERIYMPEARRDREVPLRRAWPRGLYQEEASFFAFGTSTSRLFSFALPAA